MLLPFLCACKVATSSRGWWEFSVSQEKKKSNNDSDKKHNYIQSRVPTPRLLSLKDGEDSFLLCSFPCKFSPPPPNTPHTHTCPSLSFLKLLLSYAFFCLLCFSVVQAESCETRSKKEEGKEGRRKLKEKERAEVSHAPATLCFALPDLRKLQAKNCVCVLHR